MTGKAAGAWNKPPINLPQKRDDTSFPGLNPAASPEIATRHEYEERQNDELLALEAIYGEDFVKQAQTHSVWKKSEPSFDIRIRAPSDDDFAVTLGVVFTATYPRSPPLLTLKNLGSVRDATQFRIQKYIEKQPPILALEGQEMVDQIVEGIREILEDAAQSKARGLELPSLEQERAIHEAELAKLAQEQRAQEERKKAEEAKESERVLSGLIQEHVKRQQDLAKESRKKNRASGFGAPLPIMNNGQGQDDGQIIFDRPCRTTDSNGNEISFQAVSDKREVAQGAQTTVYSVRPVLVGGGQECPLLALKQTQIKTAGKDKAQIKKQIQALEPLLESLKAVRHKNLLQVVDFRLEGEFEPGDGKHPSLWNLIVLTPLSNKGSLDELLDLAGTLELSKVRTWTRDLLDALTFLHNKSITHQDIHLGNVLLFKESTGEIVPKLADAGYQKELHGMFAQGRALPGLAQATTAYWLPPEIAATSRPTYTHKTDVWDFGIVVAQMLFGREVTRRYQSPTAFVEATNLSKSLRELVTRFFKQDPKKRPRAFELTSSEFLATDAPAVTEDSVGGVDYASSLSHSLQGPPQRLRRESMNKKWGSSRYREDFVEEGRLGKGGFGEVVKARKKLDGQIYAIKKISQRSQASLTEILREVRLLAQLSHPAVVRYYNTWVEEFPDTSDGDSDEDDDETEGATESRVVDDNDDDSGPDIQFAASTTGGLDYMSFQADEDDAGVMFTNDISDLEPDDGDDLSTDSDEDSTSNPASPLARRNGLERRPSGRTYRTVLYISMEYCEKRTLRDLIARKLYQNGPELWRIFRQILEGLVHIHSLSIVHRDLKPENIFIAHSADGTDNIKIGDFGLATSGRIAAEKGIANALESDEITRSIGTASYAAPEVRSASSISYNDKVDMYSLGVIFFEMSYPPVIGMHRAEVIGKLRRSPPVLPADFKPVDKVQTEIVQSLLTHNPKNRPSSSELLQSGKLPVQMESETIRRTLAGLSDPSSPFYQKMLSTLFARPNEKTKDYTWDMHASSSPTPADVLNQNIVKKTLISIFRRHGALEMPRSGLYPRSAHYGDNVVKLLDTSGTVLQLPYDLTMGHARALAKQTGAPVLQRTYTFGSIFRDRQDSSQPQMLGEVDFDIVTTDTLDLALKEAEVIKVLDEIVSTFPSLSSAQMCFHVGHSELLQLIFEYCRVEPAARRPAADVLSKLNIHGFTWQKIRSELRSPIVGASATSVDELQRFDFRDTPIKAFAKLKSLFEGTDMYQRATSTLAHLREVYEYAKRLGVVRKIYVNPLNSLKESFYTGGILFSCLHDKKQRDVFAAGGRYDSLIREHRPRIGGHLEERHAVGFNLAWERLARVPKTGGKAFLKKTEEEPHGLFNDRRCDVLVASFDAAVLRSTGVEILQTLWSHNISAELARDARSPEDLMSKYRDDNHSWIIIIKQDSILKMKSMHKKDMPDADIPLAQLISWLRGEIREREQKAGARPRAPQHAEPASAVADIHREQEVRVLVAQTKSKKFNRRTVVEQAQVSAANLVQSFLDGPILAVETSDQIMDAMRGTSLSDAESWRRLEHAVSNADKKYVKEVHEMLDEWRFDWEKKGASRHSFLYNFRSGTCIYYDLGA